MKKFCTCVIILLIGFPLVNAMNIHVSRGKKLGNSAWGKISKTLNEIENSQSDLKIKGNLFINGKLCSESGCLGECFDNEVWDLEKGKCIIEGTTIETALSSCLEVKQKNIDALSGYYYIDSDGQGGDAPKNTYCDFSYTKPVPVNSSYKKEIKFNSIPSTILSDYPILVTLDTASLISNSKMKNDCGDIRFYDLNGDKLSYWLESGCGTNNTKIRVKQNEISSSLNKFYIYYGDNGNQSESNGVQVFSYFDDLSVNSGWKVNLNSDLTCRSSWDGRGYWLGKGNKSTGSSSAGHTEDVKDRFGGEALLVWGNCGDDYGVVKNTGYSGSNYRMAFWYSTRHKNYSNSNPPSGSSYYYYNSGRKGLSYLGSSYTWKKVEIVPNNTIGFRTRDTNGTEVNSTRVYVSEVYVRKYSSQEPTIVFGTEVELK